MSDPRESKSWWRRFAGWVEGGQAARDPTTQYVFERRPPRPHVPPEIHEQWERWRLKRFLGLYPVAAGLLCFVLIAILLATALTIPPFGQPGNPTNNEVSQHYLEYTEEETGATNAVTGMILSYRGFDTLGESCVLFLAVSSVLMLLERDINNTNDYDLRWRKREDDIERAHPDNILRRVTVLLTPFIFLFAVYVLLNGETSPGGGFSGGAILGGGAILYSSAFGAKRAGKVFTRRLYNAVRLTGLVLYALVYGCNIFMGANGISGHMEWMMTLIDLAVGMVVACTIYGFYTMFQRGEV